MDPVRLRHITAGRPENGTTINPTKFDPLPSFNRASILKSFKMSPLKVNLLPSPAALPSYGISENGFLPAEQPLTRLPHAYYQLWEELIEELPQLLKAGQWRQRVDELPVLDTSHLESEREWQRAYSMLAVMAQAYIWQGPEPSEVGGARVLIRAAC